MMHLACQEARKRGRKIGVLLIDLEAQYQLTIDHAHEMLELYADVVEPYWVALPLILRNAVSMYEPRWLCWDPDCEDMWVRERPARAIGDENFFPFFKRGMEFEEFVPAFGEWYSQGKLTCTLVGIRTDESLNRFRAIMGDHSRFEGQRWTTWKGGHVFNAYPIYDWRTEDLWTFYAKTGLPHNTLYDRMHQAGLSIHQMRICQPYGDDQRKGLWLYHAIEPHTWPLCTRRTAETS
jgi:predicted phosphoadenosine phosphosulfate sulfurtransferase